MVIETVRINEILEIINKMITLVMRDRAVRLIDRKRVSQLITGACRGTEAERGEILLIGIVAVGYLLDLTVLSSIDRKAAVIELLLCLLVSVAKLFLKVGAYLLHELIGKIRERGSCRGLLFHVVGRDPRVNVIRESLVVLLLCAPAHLEHIVKT